MVSAGRNTPDPSPVSQGSWKRRAECSPCGSCQCRNHRAPTRAAPLLPPVALQLQQSRKKQLICWWLLFIARTPIPAGLGRGNPTQVGSRTPVFCPHLPSRDSRKINEKPRAGAHQSEPSSPAANRSSTLPPFPSPVDVRLAEDGLQPVVELEEGHVLGGQGKQSAPASCSPCQQSYIPIKPHSPFASLP